MYDKNWRRANSDVFAHPVVEVEEIEADTVRIINATRCGAAMTRNEMRRIAERWLRWADVADFNV